MNGVSAPISAGPPVQGRGFVTSSTPKSY
jgi:hypothetical protein